MLEGKESLPTVPVGDDEFVELDAQGRPAARAAARKRTATVKRARGQRSRAAVAAQDEPVAPVPAPPGDAEGPSVGEDAAGEPKPLSVAATEVEEQVPAAIDAASPPTESQAQAPAAVDEVSAPIELPQDQGGAAVDEVSTLTEPVAQPQTETDAAEDACSRASRCSLHQEEGDEEKGDYQQESIGGEENSRKEDREEKNIWNQGRH